MPAAIFGERFVGVREPAWHGLGTVIKEPIPIAEAMELAGVNYDIEKWPLVAAKLNPDGSLERALDTPFFATVREAVDGSEEAVLGVVSDEYTVLQNYELAEMLEPLNERWPIETVGALGNGEVAFFTMDAGEFTVNGTDKVRRFVFASTGHDGKTAINWGLTQVRIVCSNTFNAALSNAQMTYRIPHKGDVKGETQLVADLFKGLESNIDTETRVTQQLGQVSVSDDEANEIFEAAYPVPNRPRKLAVSSALASESITKEQVKNLLKSDGAAGRMASSYQAAIDRRIALLDGTREVYGALNEGYPDIANTAWAAFNAVTEMSNWREGPNADRAVMFGVRNDEMNRARVRTLELANIS